MKLSLQMHSLRTIPDWIALAQQAEALGFAELHIAERLDYLYPTWPTLYLMAEHTQRIGLGVSVTNPYSRHPAVTAKMAAMLHNFSHGRASLGIGHGDLWQFDQLGIPHHKPLTALREAVLLIRYLWSGSQAGFVGEVFSIKPGIDLKWKLDSESPLISIGTSSPGGMQIAGEAADELHIPFCVDPAFVAFARHHVHKGWERTGEVKKGATINISPQSSISLDHEAAIRHTQVSMGRFIEWMRIPGQILRLDPEEVARLGEAKRRGDDDYLHRNVSERYIRAFSVSGTPGEVIEQIESLADLGVEHILFSEPGPNLKEALTLLGEKVLPHFALRES